MFPQALIGILQAHQEDLYELAQSLVAENDGDQDGVLTADEFDGAFEFLVGNAEGLKEEHLQAIFDEIANEDGQITAEDFLGYFLEVLDLADNVGGDSDGGA